MKKVVVTGIGMLCACGNGKDAAWANLKAGKPGIGRITAFDPSRCTCQVAGEVKDFDQYAIDGGLIDRRAARHMARFSQFAVAAAVEAWKDAGYTDEKKPDMDRVGVMMGIGIGGLEVTGESYFTLFEKGPERLSPLAVPELIPNEAAGNVSIALGAKGPAQIVATACASSTDALGLALDMVRAGRADVMVAGGAEAVITEFTVGGFMKMRALSTHFNDTPEKASRPFNADRDGFVMGEGAAVLILETEEHAKARGAKVYAELAGYGATSDAYHITAPDPSGVGAMKAIEIALKDAGVSDKSTVDYINAHGTSTLLNDQMETKAFKTVFGEEGAKKINISSTKSMHGHLLGGAGALEAAITALAISEGFVPPTINYEKPDLEVDATKGEVPLDLNYTPNTGVKREIRVALSSSLGFGGHNGILVLKKAIGA
ncbi:MAG: beta-ketoacyl-ACP synthase II [Kiritimatiellae bacterium]|nr:beta-ketoacyl-ACP synthase II [Kiritimatiellia bacterium]